MSSFSNRKETRTMTTHQTSLLNPAIPFSMAGELWLKSQEPHVSPRTIKDQRRHVRFLTLFFANKKLDEITCTDVSIEYQTWRKQNLRRPEVCHHEFPGNNTINRESEILRLILKAADLWVTVGRHYRPLPEPQLGPGQALRPEEAARLFELAATQSRWFVAMCCVLISANTTAGPGEIRNLRLCDIKIDAEVPHILIQRGTKNRFRIRELALND